MKFSKQIILISIITLMMLPFFLISRATVAQEWTYNGADTEKIPGFSVYPSEWYLANVTGIYGAPENYTILEVIKGNLTDWFDTPWGFIYPGANGTNVWGSVTIVNATSGSQHIQAKRVSLAWWNESVVFLATPPTILPVEEDGKVSAQILNHVMSSWAGLLVEEGSTYEYYQIYPNIYSYAFWNTSNGAYWKSNFTEGGIVQKIEHHLTGVPWPNITLMSQPLQLPPDFTFTTETGSLTLDSTDFKLNISIMDADNNNDGITDEDYLYHIQNGTTWSDWTTLPSQPLSQIDWDLGDVAAGSYDITIEVKNMYGVTQKDITIQYGLPEDGDGEEIIPGYPITLISFVAIFGISIIILRYRKKLRL